MRRRILIILAIILVLLAISVAGCDWKNPLDITKSGGSSSPSPSPGKRTIQDFSPRPVRS